MMYIHEGGVQKIYPEILVGSRRTRMSRQIDIASKRKPSAHGGDGRRGPAVYFGDGIGSSGMQ